MRTGWGLWQLVKKQGELAEQCKRDDVMIRGVVIWQWFHSGVLKVVWESLRTRNKFRSDRAHYVRLLQKTAVKSTVFRGEVTGVSQALQRCTPYNVRTGC